MADGEPPQPILITGASGFVGRHLVGYLRERGLRVTAMVRRRETAPPADAVVVADLTDPPSVARAAAGHPSIVHLAGAADVASASLNAAVNVGGMEALIAAARPARARILYVSSQCVERPLQDAYARTKAAAEARLADGGVPHVILRPTMLLGAGSKELTTFVETVRRWPVVPIIGSGRSTVRPVDLRDVLPLVPVALSRDAPLGRRYTICGPTAVSFDRLVALVAGALGRRRRVIHVPGRLALLGARLLGRFQRHPVITPDQVMAFLQDTVADPTPAMRELGFDPRPVEVALAELFARGAFDG